MPQTSDRQRNVLTLHCPYCAAKAPHGVTVCRGCGAEVVYGTTFAERAVAFFAWLALALVLGAVAAFFLPVAWWIAVAVSAVVVFALAPVDIYRGEIRYLRDFDHV